MTFDSTLPVQTRDGRKARIICTDWNNEPDRLIVLIELSNGTESQAQTRYPDGTYLSLQETDEDLINIPEKRWIGVFRGDDGEILPIDETFDSPEETKAWFAQEKLELIACIPFTEGDGLNE